MHKLTITTVVTIDMGSTPSISVTSHTIDFDNAEDMNKYVYMMGTTDMKSGLSFSIHRFFEGHND